MIETMIETEDRPRCTAAHLTLCAPVIFVNTDPEPPTDEPEELRTVPSRPTASHLGANLPMLPLLFTQQRAPRDQPGCYTPYQGCPPWLLQSFGLLL